MQCTFQISWLAILWCFGSQELDLNSQAAQIKFLSNQTTGQFFANLQKRCEFLQQFSSSLTPFFPRNSDLQHFTFSLSQTTCHIHFIVHFHLVTQTKIRAAILLGASYPQVLCMKILQHVSLFFFFFKLMKLLPKCFIIDTGLYLRVMLENTLVRCCPYHIQLKIQDS